MKNREVHVNEPIDDLRRAYATSVAYFPSTEEDFRRDNPRDHVEIVLGMCRAAAMICDTDRRGVPGSSPEGTSEAISKMIISAYCMGRSHEGSEALKAELGMGGGGG